MITSNYKKGLGLILIFLGPFSDHFGPFLGPFWGVVSILSATVNKNVIRHQNKQFLKTTGCHPLALNILKMMI